MTCHNMTEVYGQNLAHDRLKPLYQPAEDFVGLLYMSR